MVRIKVCFILDNTVSKGIQMDQILNTGIRCKLGTV